MTALNAFVAADTVHVFSDGGIYNEQGKMVCLKAKVDLLASMSGVIASTGPVDLSRSLAFVLGKENPATFDELLSGLHGYLAAAVGILEVAKETGLETFEIIIAAYDEAEDRPRLARAVCVDGKITVGESNLFRSPKLAPGDIPDYDTDKPRESGLALLEAQRRALCGILAIPGSAAHVVGGVAHHTVVSRDGVTTSIIRRWPDVVGEKLRVAA
jgi:hypothetical protein